MFHDYITPILLQGDIDPLGEDTLGVAGGSQSISSSATPAGNRDGYVDWVLKRLIRSAFGRVDLWIGDDPVGPTVSYPFSYAYSGEEKVEGTTPLVLPVYFLGSLPAELTFQANGEDLADYSGVRIVHKCSRLGVRIGAKLITAEGEQDLGTVPVTDEWDEIEVSFNQPHSGTLQSLVLYVENESGTEAFSLSLVRVSLEYKGFSAPVLRR